MNLIHSMVDLPMTSALLLKATLLLAAGWTSHLLFRQANPRWRTLLWRGIMAGLILLPLLSLLMPLRVQIAQPAPPPSRPGAIIRWADAFPSQPMVATSWSPTASDVPARFATSPPSPPVDRISALRTWTRNHWPSLAVALWLSGILLLVIRLLTGVGRVRRLHRSAQPAPDDCQALLHQVTADLGLSSKVDLAIVRDLNSPLLHGLRRPTIYLPQRLIRRDNPSELTAIFAHELAHLASHDLLWLRVARWISILLWPHPLAWRLPAAHAAVCEEVSDRAAANYIKDPMSYSRTLARAALAMVGHTRVEMGIPMARTSDIGRRLRALTRKVDASPLARRSMALSLLAGAITLGLVGGIRLVYAETTPEADRPASTAVAPGERLLRFPADRALGRLMIRHAHEPMRKPQTYFYNPTFEENWTFLAAAQGDVIIPSDSKVRLELNTDGGRDLRPLAALKPDDLDAFGWGYCSLEPTDDDVRQITRLTGLTQIDLQVSVRGMDGTDPCRLSAQSFRALGALPNLECLTLPYHVSDDQMKELGGMPGLKRLNFISDQLSPRGVAAVAAFADLEELALGGRRLTGSGLGPLADLPRLARLRLWGNNLTDSALVPIGRMHSLRMLGLLNHPISDAGLAQLSSLTRLESLNLAKTPLTDAGMVHLTSLKSLKSLDLGQTSVGDRGLGELKKLPSLEHLDFNVHGPSYDGVTDQGLKHLEAMRGLKSLRLSAISNCEVSDAGIRSLSGLTQLEELSLGGKGITDRGMADLAKLRNLKKLSFGTTAPGVTNQGLRELSRLTALEELNLGGTAVTISGLNCLNDLPRLRQLKVSLSRWDLTGEPPLDLSRLAILETLELPAARNQDLACLSGLTSLNRLQIGTLPGGSIDDVGIGHLRTVDSLQLLNIGGPGISDAGLAALAGMDQLDHLSIWGNFTDVGLQHLVDLKSLTYINIRSGCEFSSDALERLSSQLPLLSAIHVDQDATLRPKVTTAFPAEGSPAPPIEVQTLDGKAFSLAEQRGKVVMLYFWSTYCAPCIAQTDDLKTYVEEMQREFDRFVMVSLSLDTNAALARAHVDKHNLAWPQARIGDMSRVAESYGVGGVPAFFLIGPDGRVLLNPASPQTDARVAIAKALGLQPNP